VSAEGKDPLGSLPEGETVRLDALVSVAPGAVVSRTLVKHPGGSITLFSFDREQGLSEHTAPFDALVCVLSGKAEIKVGGKTVTAGAGEAVFMPANVPHALKAEEAFKMLLVMLKKE
jgi:quercetin dioxygenase-like cupin family protein